MIKKKVVELTQYDNLFPIWFGKRVRNSKLGQDDQGTMDSGPKPEDMCMPPKCASLACKSKVIDLGLARLNWALGYVCWPISPTCSQVSDTIHVQFQFTL